MNYSLLHTINTITDNWALKAGLSILVTLEYHAGIFGLFCLLVISYLTMTELLSMVENLDEAGISSMHDLINLIKGRRK